MVCVSSKVDVDTAVPHIVALDKGAVLYLAIAWTWILDEASLNNPKEQLAKQEQRSRILCTQ